MSLWWSWGKTLLSMALWCRERVDWRMEWRSVVFSDESRFCLYASDGHTRVRHRPGERHLPKCIRPRHTGLTSGFMVWGLSVTTLMFLQCKENSARIIAQVLKPVLVSFFDRKVMWFSAGWRTSTYGCCDAACSWWLQLPWPARTPNLSPIEHVCDMMKRELTLSLEPVTTIVELRQWMQDRGTIYRRMTFGTFMTIWMREYTPALPPERVHYVLMWMFGHLSLWHVVFTWSEFVIIYSHNKDGQPAVSMWHTQKHCAISKWR